MKAVLSKQNHWAEGRKEFFEALRWASMQDGSLVAEMLKKHFVKYDLRVHKAGNNRERNEYFKKYNIKIRKVKTNMECKIDLANCILENVLRERRSHSPLYVSNLLKIAINLDDISGFVRTKLSSYLCSRRRFNSKEIPWLKQVLLFLFRSLAKKEVKFEEAVSEVTNALAAFLRRLPKGKIESLLLFADHLGELIAHIKDEVYRSYLLEGLFSTFGDVGTDESCFIQRIWISFAGFAEAHPLVAPGLATDFILEMITSELFRPFHGKDMVSFCSSPLSFLLAPLIQDLDAPRAIQVRANITKIILKEFGLGLKQRVAGEKRMWWMVRLFHFAEKDSANFLDFPKLFLLDLKKQHNLLSPQNQDLVFSIAFGFLSPGWYLRHRKEEYAISIGEYIGEYFALLPQSKAGTISFWREEIKDYPQPILNLLRKGIRRQMGSRLAQFPKTKIRVIEEFLSNP